MTANISHKPTSIHQLYNMFIMLQDGKQISIEATDQRVWVNTTSDQNNTALIIANAQRQDSDEYYCELTWDKGSLEGADSEYIKRQVLQYKIRVSGELVAVKSF